jgi:hypothetical protein
MKMLIVLLFIFISTLAFSALPENNSYLEIAKTPDGTATIYIGAAGSYAPRLISDDNVIFETMFVQNKAQNGMTTGEQFESVGLVNCDAQLYKLVVIWHKPSAKDKGVYAFPEKTLIDDVFADFKQQEAVKAKPNSIMAMVIDAACNYVDNTDPKRKLARDLKDTPKIRI